MRQWLIGAGGSDRPERAVGLGDGVDRAPDREEGRVRLARVRVRAVLRGVAVSGPVIFMGTVLGRRSVRRTAIM